MSDLGEVAVNALFPTFVFGRDHSDAAALNKRFADAVYALMETDPIGAQVSNRGGWQSKPTLAENPDFAPLIHFIDDTMLQVKEFLNASANVHFFVGSCWANFNPRGGFNARHMHGNAYFSGVYYVRATPAAGRIEFGDPRVTREYYNFPCDEMTPRNCFTQGYDPLPGRMFIFPGYLPHQVTENLSDDDRISISFNISAHA